MFLVVVVVVIAVKNISFFSAYMDNARWGGVGCKHPVGFYTSQTMASRAGFGKMLCGV